MGHTCSKATYYEEDDLYFPGILTESNPRSSRRRNKKLHHGSGDHRGGLSGIARTDPALFALQKRSIALFNHQLEQSSNDCEDDANDHTAATSDGEHDGSGPYGRGQYHLLFRQQQKSVRQPSSPQQQSPPQQQQRQPASPRRQQQRPQPESSVSFPEHVTTSEDDKIIVEARTEPFEEDYSTRLIVRRQTVRALEEGLSGTHIYAVRWPRHEPLNCSWKAGQQQEQSPRPPNLASATNTIGNNKQVKKTGTLSRSKSSSTTVGNVDELFHPNTLAAAPEREVHDWVTVSEEHSIYLADTGLTAAECDRLVGVTEQACRGHYAAYTYAKQTLGCREFPPLACAVQNVVHTTVHGILTTLGVPDHVGKNLDDDGKKKKKKILALDDREPHMVKYDVTRKERQKLDMHTDKSEWTFLVALSDGCGMDYEGGGTYFECLDSTIHVQRGHALIFPGKLRHCGQRISHGLRFLLVGFLVDKSPPTPKTDGGDDDEDKDDAPDKCRVTLPRMIDLP